MSAQKSQPLLNAALVIGGCGFIGYHLVKHLLEDEECGDVYVLDRKIENNRQDGVVYIQGDLSNAEEVRAHLAKIKPRVVFHTASPIAALPANKLHEFEETNVKGTKILIEESRENNAVEALVYTSTVDIYAQPPHNNVEETHPLFSETDKSNEYNRTKSIADGLIRAANGPDLRTACVRLGHAYGERHTQGLVEILDMCTGDQKLFQIGDGKNLMEVVSADNAATGHILAAKALVDPERAHGKVDGEAFNISDGAPVPFWHHIRVIWGVARGKEALDEVVIIPEWFMMGVVWVMGWMFWLFTFNTVQPPTAMRKASMEYCIYSHTYSVDKAKACLGFQPVVDHDRVLAQSVEWFLERRKETEKAEKTKTS